MYNIEDVEKMKVSKNDRMNFQCKSCGKCCHDIDILLSPEDVFRAAKYLNINCVEFIENYTDIHIGDNSKLPLTYIKMVGPDKHCSFLKSNNRCAIHEQKPSVCAVYPLGRFISFQKSSTNGKTNNAEVEYLIQPVKCGKGPSYTVEDFLKKSHLLEREEDYIAYSNKLTELVSFNNELMGKFKANKFSKETATLWLNTVFAAMYVSYDTSGNFIEQFNANVDALKETSNAMLSFFSNN